MVNHLSLGLQESLAMDQNAFGKVTGDFNKGMELNGHNFQSMKTQMLTRLEKKSCDRSPGHVRVSPATLERIFSQKNTFTTCFVGSSEGKSCVAGFRDSSCWPVTASANTTVR